MNEKRSSQIAKDPDLPLGPCLSTENTMCSHIPPQGRMGCSGRGCWKILLVERKGCGRGALFGFCKCLDQTFPSWGARNGQEQPVLLVEGTCCCFEQIQSCKVLTCLLLLFDRRTTQGIRFRQLSEFGTFKKKKKCKVISFSVSLKRK